MDQISAKNEYICIKKSKLALFLKLVFISTVTMILCIFLFWLSFLSQNSLGLAKFAFFLSLVLILAALIIILIATANWLFETYWIEKNRLVVEKGFFVYLEEEYPLDEIERIEVIQWRLGKKYKFGDLNLYKSKEDKITLNSVAHPEESAKLIEKMKQELLELKKLNQPE